MKNISTDGSGKRWPRLDAAARRAAAAKVNYTDTRIIHDVNVYETSIHARSSQIKSFSGSAAGSDTRSSSSSSSSSSSGGGGGGGR